MTNKSNVQMGDAAVDVQRGWVVGSFIDEKLGLRHSDDVELKWGIHPTGEERAELGYRRSENGN